MKEFKVGDRVKIVAVEGADSFEQFVGKEGVVSYLFPNDNAPYPIYVDFNEVEVKMPFARNEVEVVA